MKKIISLLVLTCMVLCMCANVLAEELLITQFFISTDRTEGTFYTYDADGKRIKVEVGPDALTVNVEAVNCEENNVYSGIVELYYDDSVMQCLGAKSYTGGTWVANTNLPGKVRLVFSTGADPTEDGVILSAAFEYLEEPAEGDEAEFTLDVEQLCTDKSGDDKYVDFDVPDGEEFTYVYEEPVFYLYGDANGDEKVNTADAVVVLKYAAEMMTLDETHFTQADVNFDGNVNTGDAVVILKFCVGMITDFQK